jgi:hypothetical protein
MLALITPIDVINNIPKIRKLDVVDVIDKADELPPYIVVKTVLYGAGGASFREQPYNLVVHNSGRNSTVLRVNATPTKILDQVVFASVDLSGNQYTALAAAWNGATTPATRAGRLKAVEALLVSSGVLGPEFVSA